MFIDASALVAILLRELDSDDLVARFEATEERLTSPMAVWETAVAIARELRLTISDATATVETYLEQMNISITPVEPATARLALDAFDRYGKGRHPAGLNFGDCFSYACAKHLGLPLLFKGSDFSLTDTEAA